MYLEFAGLPASGKSTLSDALKNHLSKLPGNVYSRDEGIVNCLRRRDDGIIKNMMKRFPSRLWWPFMGAQFALPEFVNRSSCHLEFISFISKVLSESNMDPWLISSIWNTIIRSFCEVELVTKYIHGGELVIMDEAFFQRCFTLFGYIENRVSDDLIARYAALAPVATNHIFWIITRPENCIERLRLRYLNRPSPYELDSNELLNNFKIGNNVLKRLSIALENQGKNIYRIKGDGNTNEAITEICKISSRLQTQLK